MGGVLGFAEDMRTEPRLVGLQGLNPSKNPEKESGVTIGRVFDGARE